MTPSERSRLLAVQARAVALNTRLLAASQMSPVQVDIDGATWTYDVVQAALDDVMAIYQLDRRSLAEAERLLGEMEAAMNALEKLSEGPKS